MILILTMFTQWWLVVVPGIANMLTMLGVSLLGDVLRHVLDLRLWGRRGLGK